MSERLTPKQRTAIAFLRWQAGSSRPIQDYVADAIRAAEEEAEARGRRDEREECAKVAEAEYERRKEIGDSQNWPVQHHKAITAYKIAEAIRKRGEPR